MFQQLKLSICFLQLDGNLSNSSSTSTEKEEEEKKEAVANFRLSLPSKDERLQLLAEKVKSL